MVTNYIIDTNKNKIKKSLPYLFSMWIIHFQASICLRFFYITPALIVDYVKDAFEQACVLCSPRHQRRLNHQSLSKVPLAQCPIEFIDINMKS